MPEYLIDKENFIRYRLTPWDTQSLKLKTSEILNVQYSDTQNLNNLIRHFEEFNRINGINFSYTRVDCNDLLQKKLLMAKGFYIGETSLEIGFNNLKSYNKTLPTVKLESLDPQNLSDIEAIKEIARDSFSHSRFHDDPFIPNEAARARYFNWITDLITQKKEIYILKNKGEIIGFHVQQVNDKQADLIITGCKIGKTALSIPLWHTVLLILKESGVISVKTLISCANVGVLNLYVFFNFKIMRSLVGLHKKY